METNIPVRSTQPSSGFACDTASDKSDQDQVLSRKRIQLRSFTIPGLLARTTALGRKSVRMVPYAEPMPGLTTVGQSRPVAHQGHSAHTTALSLSLGCMNPDSDGLVRLTHHGIIQPAM